MRSLPSVLSSQPIMAYSPDSSALVLMLLRFLYQIANTLVV